MNPSMLPPPADLGPGLFQQLYVTHCRHGEGVFGRAGFHVRASSTEDPLLLRFAAEYPPYEPPLGTRRDDSAPAEAPRRLAFVRLPGGRAALIHSAYRPDDGRANNFFSHVLAGPDLTARAALATWASPDWAEGCDVESETSLPPLDGLPRPGPINDEAVTAFLQAADLPADGGPAQLPCPERLARSPGRRRELAAQVLRGCMRVLRAGPLEPRGRLYVLGEPELVALLTYAAARLLPDSLAAQLTFSTYENAHRDLRLYRHAAVVGTWTADPARGLEEEFFTTRGYGLNTVTYRASRELCADEEAPVEEWIDLAARGDWATVDKAHRMLGKMATTMVSLPEGLEAARLLRRVTAGEVGAEDLLALKRSRWGPAILRRHADRLWPRVRDGSLTDPRLGEAFADMLRGHLDELEAATLRALRDGREDWQPHWQRIAEVLRNEPGRLREAFQKVLPEPPYPPGLRVALLRALDALPPGPAGGKPVLPTLLRGCTAEDLDRLAGAELPRGWLARALCYALLEPETQAAAADRIRAADDDLLRAFWEQLQLVKEEAQRQALLAPLFPRGDPGSARLLSRVLRARVAVAPDALAWLLEWLGAWGPAWDAFWDRDDHRGLLLDLLRLLGEPAGPLWERLCGRLDADLLLPGDGPGRGLLRDLTAALDRPGPSLPPAIAEAIRDWAALRDHFEKAAAIPDEAARAAVLAACHRRRLDPVPLLARYFERFVRPQGRNPEVLDDFAGFFHSFYPAGGEYQDHASRLAGWLRVVEGGSEEERAAYQRYYLERFVSTEFRWRLAEEGRQAGRLVPAAYESVMKPTRPGAAPARGPGATREDELFRVLGVGAGGPLAPPWAVWWRFPWLLCGAAAGVLAAVLAGPLMALPRAQAPTMVGLIVLLPLVLTVAEAMAVQAAVLTARFLQKQAEPALRAQVVRELLAGLIGAAMCGLVTGAAAAWFGPLRQAVCLGGCAAVAVAAAGGAALAVSVLVARLGLLSRLPVGPAARAAAGMVAVAVYFSLARLLLG